MRLPCMYTGIHDRSQYAVVDQAISQFFNSSFAAMHENQLTLRRKEEETKFSEGNKY